MKVHKEKDKMSRNTKIDKLLNMPCFLIDILPEQVAANSTGQYFSIEEFFRRDKMLKIFYQKIITILLKINCYYDFIVKYNNTWEKKPDPKKLNKLIKRCISGKKEHINILINGRDTMIAINGDDLYICVYNPDEKMKGLICELARSEGLFFHNSEISNEYMCYTDV